MPNIGPLEIIIVLVVVLLIFGPKRLPDLGRSLGGGMREFKDSVTGKSKDRDDQPRPQLVEVVDERQLLLMGDRLHPRHRIRLS